MLVKLQKWQKELMAAVKTSHFVILHSNVYDEIYWGDKRFDSLEDWLRGLGSRHDVVVSYNLAKGINVHQGEAKEFLIVKSDVNLSQKEISILIASGIAPSQEKLPNEPQDVLVALDKLLSQKEKKVFLILEYADALASENVVNQSDLIRQSIIIRLKSWARNVALRQAGHLIILLVRQLTALDKGLRDTQLGVTAIRINKPDETERELLLNLWQVSPDKIKPIAHITAGLGSKQMRQLVESGNGDLFGNIITARQRYLSVEYGHILRFIEPEFGLEAVGGLDAVVKRLRKIVHYMREGRTNLVPQGILLVGPPRTGKTILARGLAKEAGVLYAELLSLRNKYVGESERLQEELENVTSEVVPLFIFLDELDGRLGERSGYRGDGGVAEGELSAILKMTSDTSKQGKVLWIFACNKPWLLDKALLEPGRTDERIPIAPPQTAQQRVDIFKVMLLQCRCQAEQGVDWLSLADSVPGYTGGDIRWITQKALEKAVESDREIISETDYRAAIEIYIPPQADEDIQRMTIEAFRLASSKEFLTPEVAKALQLA